MKKFYTKPELEVTVLSSADIILNSGIDNETTIDGEDIMDGIN